ncbi:hypothetical protein AMD27_11405 [Acinetobacter sp. TGL-Y2]|uniref:DUF2513 domain-containing protein n=1 Tax=Acinetobacter sp. TGL-Y2 TaxID=1407071 RepID=UPI0007A65180|nr:DUF2513 domain-containing protein [Acinetobacter sp. TGL-Y2]AMW79433.1 hypothetical protein AMD27_11405 [Acinetobacter sp. TGL-Y2]
MKRDWEIIRQVLIVVEEDRFDEYLDNAENQKIVIDNTVLLINANFIDGNILSNLETDEDVHVKCLTWQGHELLDTMMYADKNGDFHLVNYTYSLRVYHEQKTEVLHSKI